MKTTSETAGRRSVRYRPQPDRPSRRQIGTPQRARKVDSAGKVVGGRDFQDDRPSRIDRRAASRLRYADAARCRSRSV